MAKIYGLPACSCQIAWLPVYTAELARRGITVRWVQLIGQGSKSGGTHAGGGACDEYLVSWPKSMTKASAWFIAIWVARQMGADASWHRPHNWDNRGGEEHGHLVLTDCPHNGPARYQIADVRNGLNGLAKRAKDDGPRPLSGRTWRQGIAWAKTLAAPVDTRTTVFKAATFNVRSKTSGFPKRVPVIRARVFAFAPNFLLCQELAPAPRALLSAALRSLYRMSSNGHNKVEYLRVNKNGWVKVKSVKYVLGHNRHAIAVQYRHRTTAAVLVVATPHPSWEHSAAADRTSEAGVLTRGLERDFPGLPKLIGGDFNDAHKDTRTRPNDSFGDALEDAGYHDLYYDVPTSKKRGRTFNTAHQNLDPAPESGIHLDRFFGTKELDGLTWLNDVHTGRRGSDHWMVGMQISLTHPVTR